MSKGVVPRMVLTLTPDGGFSHTRGWIFGYKLHLISSTGPIIIPLSADFTTANVHDNQMYNSIIFSSATRNMLYEYLSNQYIVNQAKAKGVPRIIR
jgi:hypothetical protein